MSSPPPLRIGTRGSRLALAQTDEVRDRLAAAHPRLSETGAVEVKAIRTTGDKVRDRPLAEIGGKGLFTKEIDEALLDGRIDLAVHSVKDLPTWLPDGIELAAFLPREDPRDVLLSPKANRLAELPAGSVVGTSSLRRQALILHARPDLTVVTFRGNVETRMQKLADGVVDATVLALAGLRRLGHAGPATAILEPEEMLPAVGQGAIGVTCRRGDRDRLDLLAAIHHPATGTCVTAERAMLAALEGSCRTPIAGLAESAAGNDIRLRGLIARPDGRVVLAAEREGADFEALGRALGEELRRRAGPGFFEG